MSDLASPNLHAFVLRFTAAADGALPASVGHQAQALFLDLVRQVAPALAERLHAGPPSRPYTIAAFPLPARTQGDRVEVRAGAPIALRATLLESQLFGPFVQALLSRRPGAALRLGSLPLLLA